MGCTRKYINVISVIGRKTLSDADKSGIELYSLIDGEVFLPRKGRLHRQSLPNVFCTSS